ncbi:hypothetical protein [Salinarchaeum sp. Harcht-Bsk1]|uniref:DUF7286 family protein n=1 Tax=Salinarchaeum sp. Harcht-Bsk1 TaxID=1333523 RepID=UPI001181AD99|nr:hypothetical protein [Salinarchaeum sp. Harcht-Bsk1]
MRLAEDERGRVPFALIGVLLLLGSVAVATVQLDDSRIDQNVALAGDRAEAAAETTLRDAVRDAGARAAANPVITPAETTYGEVLDQDRPYRSYLELLIAIELRERLDGTTQRVGNATATVALQPIEDPASARAAIEATTVSATDRGLVAVTVEDVPIAIQRDESTVARRHRTLSVNVTTPVLTLHERTTTFDDRLSGETLEVGSLSRGLTGGLYGLGWTRGYGQYLGLPIEDVIANGHVELVTNLAMLDVQRSVFGNSDREGERRLAEAAVAAAEEQAVGAIAGGFRDAALPYNESTQFAEPSVDPPEDRSTTVGVNDTADRALADLLDGESNGDATPVGDDAGSEPWEYALREYAETAASIDARLRTERVRHERTLVDRERPTGSGWTRVGVVDTEPVIEAVREGDARLPESEAGWYREREHTRVVELTEIETVRYRHENGTIRNGADRYSREVDVGLAIGSRPLPRSWIPERSIGTTDGDRYQALVDRAETRLLAERGGVDEIARTVAATGELTGDATVSPDDEATETISRAAYAALIPDREAIRDVQTRAPVTHALTGASPIADLRERIRADAERYRSIPAEYGSLEERAVVSAEGLYLDHVLRRLGERSSGASGVRESVTEKIGASHDAGLDALLDVGMNYARPEPATIDAQRPAPDLDLTVDAGPGYLSREAETETTVPPPRDPYHPIGVRTSTIASLPTDHVTQKIANFVTGLFGEEREERAPLPMAARTLRSVDAIDEERAADGGLAQPRSELRDAVGSGLEDVNDAAVDALEAETSLDEEAATSVVTEALDRWSDDATRVIAYDDGRATAAVAEVAGSRDGVSRTDADRAQTMMRDAVAENFSDDSTHVALDTVESTSEPARRIVESAVQEGVEQANEQIVNATQDRIRRATGLSVLPTRGVPVTPVPGWWYATANVWHVEVHGTYASFAVRAEQGGPSGGSQLSYVRDGGGVHVDVDGDGRPERLGASSRIQFYASTTVAVVVPTGGGGVGNEGTGFVDVSPGWNATRRGPDCPQTPGGVGQSSPNSCSNPWHEAG